MRSDSFTSLHGHAHLFIDRIEVPNINLEKNNSTLKMQNFLSHFSMLSCVSQKSKQIRAKSNYKLHM